MEERFNLTKSEIIERRLLDYDDSLSALRYIGIEKISENLIRQYLTRRLISRPQIGPDIKSGAKYRSYFSKTDLLAIADIRIRLDSGESLEEIAFDSVTLIKRKQLLSELRDRIIRANMSALPTFEEIKKGKIVSGEHRTRIIQVAEFVKIFMSEEEGINKMTLGQNIDPKYSKKLNEFLDEKFKHE